MTELASERGPGLSGIAWGELRRRPVFRLALWALAALCSLAVYAPFLASDRPLVLSAVHRDEFDRARKGLVAPGRSLASLVADGHDAYANRHADPDAPTWDDALAAEGRAIEARLDVLAESLDAQATPVLDAARHGVERTLELARSGRMDDARRSADVSVELAVEIGRLLDPASVTLTPVLSFPVVAALSPLEVLLQVAWAGLLVALVRRRATMLRWVALVAVAAALARAFAGGHAGPFDTAGFKEELTSGGMQAGLAWFAPVPYGFAEQHPEEDLRPPTWLASAELSSAGAYVRGARVPRPDEVTGFVPATRPVDVRAGEPDVNSPWRHLLGTDASGRDLLARLLHGARASLAVGLLSTLLLLVVGVLVGALAGTFAGRTDLLLSRFIEVFVCFPVLFLVLALVAFVGPSTWNVIAVIGLASWTSVARLARAEFLRERERDYVAAARTLGFSWARIAFGHVLPNALAPLLVAGTFAVAGAILVESTLSFLGYGVRVPIPSWGSLASESRDPTHWWLLVFPGACLFVTVLCVHALGDALRDAVDVRGGAR